MGVKLGLCFILREKQCVENRILKRISGSKREEVVGDWTKLHDTDLHNLHSSPNIITTIKSRRMRWVEYSTHEMMKKHNILFRTPERKKPPGRPRCTRHNNIKMAPKRTGCENVGLFVWFRTGQPVP
jgi:hypothetical protein